MKKTIIIYALLILYIILNAFVVVPSKIPYYNELINPLMWIIICATAIFLSKESGLRIKDESNKTQSLVIVMVVYIIIYFLLGLVFGFQRTPYSKDILHILLNVWQFGGIIFFQEIIRASLVKIEKKSIINLVIITILFILVNISFNSFMDNFSDVKKTFIYVVATLIPLIVSNGVLTYLAYIGGARLPIIYRAVISLPEFIVPILPNLDWFATAVIGLALPLAVFVYLNYIHINKTERLSRRERRKYNPAVYIPVFIFIALLAGFVVGVFKYQPIAVLSGSMHPTFDRGDAVVVKKLTTAEKDQLQKGDVVQYSSGGKYIVHRIVEIDNDTSGNRIFYTKGDNNNGVDINPVTYDQVIGEVSFIIKYIGYPSVWLSGMVS